jgi:hypothetical protein
LSTKPEHIERVVSKGIFLSKKIKRDFIELELTFLEFETITRVYVDQTLSSAIINIYGALL